MTRLTPYLTRVLKTHSSRSSTSLLHTRQTGIPLVASSLKSSSSSCFSTSALLKEKHAQTTRPPIVGSPVTGQDLMTGEMLVGADIDPSALQVELTSSPKTIPPSNQLQFGRTFTDHMLTIPWNVQSGWGTPKIVPYAPLQLDPSSTVLHYAPTLFEGMKAYKDEKGQVRLFRPDKNMERMTRSAARLAFPDFTGDHLTTLIKKLVDVDSKWVPSEQGTSLCTLVARDCDFGDEYKTDHLRLVAAWSKDIRPTMIGTQAGLGVGASTDVLLFVIACPVGPYYSTGFKPVKLLATAKDVRAWPGGTGGYKLGSNYAAGVVPQQAAAALGYQQILWLYGPEHQLTEVGTMNLFVVLSHSDGTTELVTPPLEDMILPGVTRDSVLALARAHEKGEAKLEGLPDKFKVSERNLTMPQLRQASKDGSLKEVFGSGTAAIVSPVSGIGYESELIDVPHGGDGLGDVARVMLREIVGRQTGRIESEWSAVV